MGQAEELLNSIAGAAEHVEAGYVIIGPDRYMVVPDNLKKLGVSPDHGVNTIHFVGPRYSENGSDLSKMSIWVNFMRSDEYPDACRCTNVKVDTDDETLLHYDWEISRNVTEVHGNLTVLVCAKEVDAAGNEKDHWNSELNRDFYVSEGLEVQESVLAQYPDLVEYMLLRVATVENKTTKAAMLSYVDQYLGEDPSIIIEHIEKVVAEQPIQEFVDAYLDEYVDIGTTESRVLEGSVAGAYEMVSIAGVSEQAQYEGKNLLNGTPNTPTSQGITAIPITTSGNAVDYFELKGTAENDFALALFINLSIKSGTYILSLDSEGLANAKRIYITATDFTSARVDIPANTNNGSVTFTVSQDIEGGMLYFWGAKGTTYNNILKPMLRKAEITDGTYEPYCGGKPSPSHDYPQEIKNVGPEVTVKTMQGVELTQGYWNTIGQLISGSGHVSNKTPIPCKAGDVVKITIDEEVDSFSSRCFKADGTNITHNVTRSGNTYTFTVPNDATKFCFVFVKADLTPENIGPVDVSVNGVGESSAKINLPEELRGIGDVRDILEKRAGKWGVERKRTKRVFDGVSESWGEGNSSSSKHYIYLGDASISIDETALLSHATYDLSGTLETGNFTRSGGLSFQVWTEMTLAEWKAFLAEEYAAGTPVTLEVKLATPTWEELDAAYQIALDNLQVFDGTTHVFVEGTDVQPVVNSKYGTSEVGARAITNTNRIEKLEEPIVESGSYELVGSAPGGYRLLEMQGNTEQKKLSGKNLSPINVGTSGGGFVLETYVNLLDTETYYLSFNSGFTGHIGLSVIYEGSTSYINDVIVHSIASVGRTGFAYTPSKKVFKIKIYASAVGTFTDFQIEKGSVMTPYEPYCGGVPSPNPAYPQVMKSTGDCVEMMQGYYDSTGNYQTSVENICNKYPIPCKSGDIIEIHADNVDDIYVRYYNESGFVSTSGGVTPLSLTVPSGVTKFNFRIKKNSITPQNAPKITLTINGKYVNGIKTTPNLLERLELGSIESTNGKDMVYNSNIRSVGYTPVKPTGILYVYGTKGNIRLFCYRADKSYIGSNLYPAETAIDLPSDCYYVRVHTTIADLTNGWNLVISYLPPSEFHETTAYILTNEPLRLGDIVYKDNDGLWKVEHGSTEVVFDGSPDELWAIGTLTVASRFTNYIANAKPNVEIMCTQGIYNTSQGKGCAIATSGNFYIDVDNTVYKTVADWTNHLSQNPMTLKYPLATPTIEALDPQSQIVLNGLETYKDVTYIAVDSRTKPSGIKGEYGTTKSAGYTLKALNNSESYLASVLVSEAANVTEPAATVEPETTE